MKKNSLLLLTLMATTASFAQNIDNIINVKEVERIERVLAADDMQGRRAFTPGIDKAAAFIADEFKKTGLQTLNNSGTYLQSFAMIRPKMISTTATIDGAAADAKDVVVFTCQPELKVTETSGYEKATMAAGANLRTEVNKYVNSNKNYIVFVDTSFSKQFANLNRLKSQLYKSDKNVIFIATATAPKTFTVEAKHEITEMKLANVVGILPGKSKKNEYVIFSGHYDHLGINTRNMVNNDSIYNGANDDAAGTTAVMMLAKYFKALNNNERTLIFAAFTAEEVGGYGATYFSRQYNPEEVKAMFNIEMIGTESKWGKNSAYITGYEKTSMGEILQGNLKGTGFEFHPDPYTDQNLFYRSDNATLARLGVPAHTISTSKMDSEPNYHKASDEVGTLDLDNMTMIIKAIALSSKGIVSGKETPTRVDTSTLR
ncbi:M28 family metallopeptidase [Sediminibacterium ginsengisoli]|uniref:Peptidase family M28 n=1 Tax=Sediminibacterium ginsengisoli TaxID=413434 RepID=A0A1T4K639_9BACT|nr:M28 family peptidase [Sediminibacterium ginsengisoli]SJZ37928.1 Peptidase family M28 [Sediminibacterium ginsengisoli]